MLFRLNSSVLRCSSALPLNNSRKLPSGSGNSVGWERRLSRCISVAAVYDYMFSSDIDVILKGYYILAAYLWICIMGFLNLHPISRYLTPAAFSIKRHWFGALLLMGCPLFSSYSRTADPPAKVPSLIGMFYSCYPCDSVNHRTATKTNSPAASRETLSQLE